MPWARSRTTRIERREKEKEKEEKFSLGFIGVITTITCCGKRRIRR
jgi:hypothetical protein